MSYKGKKVSKVMSSLDGYNLYAKFYDQKTKFMGTFEGYELMKIVPDLKGKKVLDLGAGTGRHMRLLKDKGAKEITAFDQSEKMLEILAKGNKDVNIVVGDVEKLPFKDASFDMVLSVFLIMHIADLEAVFREVYRVLKPGGIFVVTNINQRKSPELKGENGESIVMKSFYHMPEKVLEALEYEFFEILENGFVYEDKFWINQIIKAKK